ncbi:MAG: hypothetical protein KDB11_33165 [Planctomycetales bacterium]|nr:hypothetical protein [Planctomycetales bacterium]
MAYAGVVTGVAGTLAASFLSWLRQHSGSSKDDDVETALLRFDEKFVRGETAKQQYERSVRKKATAAVATLGGTAVAAKSSKASVCDTVTAKVNDRKTGISAKGQESNLPSIYKPEVARIVSSIDRIKERREECTKWFSEQMSALKPSVFWTPSPDDYERVFKKHNRKRQKIDADAEWIEKRAARALAEIQFFVDCATVPEIEPISRYLEQCDVERKAAEELRKKYAALEDKRRQNLKERQQYGKPPFMCGDGPIGRNLW